MIIIESATHAELLREYEECMALWSKYSCDCFGYYISGLHKAIVAFGGWPNRF